MVKTFLTVCLVVVFASPAFSQPMDKPMGRGPGQMMGMCNMDDMGDGMGMMGGGMMGNCLQHADKLGLSDDQISKIKPIHRAMQKKHAQFMADLKIAQIDMKEIMEVKDFDLEKANACAKKISDIKLAHHLEMLKSMKEVRSIFTDDQFKKMKKMMPMMMEGNKPHKKMMNRK